MIRDYYSNIKFGDYLIVLNRMKESQESNQNQKALARGFIFSGPSIMSTLAIGGTTYQLETLLGDLLQYYFDLSLLKYQNDDFFKGTHLHSSAYSGPVYVGFSPSSAFITTLGVVFSGPQVIYSPFIDIRVVFAGAHLSATIFECENPITLFDWHINVALLGVLIYQDNVQPAVPQLSRINQKEISNKEYSFTAKTVDLEQDPIFYKFNWGDGTESNWLGPFDNFEKVYSRHCWNAPGDYAIKVKAKNMNGYESQWSNQIYISGGCHLKLFIK